MSLSLQPTTSRRIALTTSAVVTAVVFAAPAPGVDLRSAIAFHDFGHVLAFGFVTVLLWYGVPFRGRQSLGRRMGGVAAVVLAAIALGVLVEILQWVTGGNGDVDDAIRDAAGTLAAALLILALTTTRWGPSRVVLSLASAIVVLTAAYPALAAFSDESVARAQFPVLASFERQIELSRFDLRRAEHVELSSTEDDRGVTVPAMRLDLPVGRYPGFALRYFPRDWRGYAALSLLMVNRAPTPLTVGIRIDDARHNNERTDRYDGSFTLVPGPNRIEIPLSAVVSAPRGRLLDIAQIRTVRIFAGSLTEPRQVLIGPIALLPSSKPLPK